MAFTFDNAVFDIDVFDVEPIPTGIWYERIKSTELWIERDKEPTGNFQFFLLENGDSLLLETSGDQLLLESTSVSAVGEQWIERDKEPAGSNQFMLLENGDFLLLESGGQLQLERADAGTAGEMWTVR
jgi:hypothetical protein